MRSVLQLMIRERTPAARAARWACLIASLFALYAASGLYLASPGTLDEGLAMDIHYLVVPVLVLASSLALVAYGLPVTALRMIESRGRQSLAHAAVFAGAFAGLALFFFLPGLSGRMWESVLARSVAEQPLAAAIQRYEAETGHPPRDLSELGPRYASGAALRTVRGCRPLQYRVDARAWSLTAECPSGWLDLDELRYRSDPDAPLAVSEVRVGSWRYHYD